MFVELLRKLTQQLPLGMRQVGGSVEELGGTMEVQLVSQVLPGANGDYTLLDVEGKESEVHATPRVHSLGVQPGHLT